MVQELRHLNTHDLSFTNSVNQLHGWSEPSEIPKANPDMIYLGVGDLGRGVFAKRPIKPGEIILVFSGPIIGFQEAVAKGDRECWPLQIGKNRYIDLQEPGCYANHSCDPNSGIWQDRFLVAIREIQKDTEIRYDYSTTVDEDHWSMDCRCKSSNCRGVISDFKYLDAALKEKYLSSGIVQNFIKAQYQ